MKAMQRAFSQVLTAERFSMRNLHGQVWPLVEKHFRPTARLSILGQKLETYYRKLAYALLRHVFLIELVVPEITTTRVRCRWYDQLKGDPRWCSFDECLEIAGDLVAALADGWLDNPQNAEALALTFNYEILPYEAPLDYQVRPENAAARIHRRGNLVWVCDDITLRTLKLRQYLANPETSPDAEFFKQVLDDKIKVKTYLTDRALTGNYKTNREKRWETHPRSVQFALRRTCMAIEHVLITQLCAFEGFPPNARQSLQAQGILPAQIETFHCPITLNSIPFATFRKELMNPTHGKSSFQVGHLNPLKLDDPASTTSGHTADNISWISEDGNRIQGSLSLKDVHALLKRIAANYEAQGWE